MGAQASAQEKSARQTSRRWQDRLGNAAIALLWLVDNEKIKIISKPSVRRTLGIFLN
jgi:hypothetical protein